MKEARQIKTTNIVYTWNLKKWYNWIYIQNRKRSTYIENNLWLRVCMPSHFSCVQLFVTLWNIAHQASLFMGFSRWEHWTGLPHPPPGELPDPEIELTSLTSPALAGRFFTTSTTWEVYQRGKGWGRDKLGVGG